MHDSSDKQSLEASPPTPKRRGRPPTGTAMSAAEKQRNYRQRQRERLEYLERIAAQVLADES